MEIVLYGILLLFIILLLIVLGSWINHLIVTPKEIKNSPPIGKFALVNDHNMHVYAEGQGDRTFVFMSGSGTTSPTICFKPLWSTLSPKNRIVVVEKAGYGWSEVADVPRDIDFMLEETRSALALTGEKPPYVLAPHSMSGLEAIRWAQKYPLEVEAVIGLDPATPAVYDVLKPPASFLLAALGFASRAGLLRLFPSIANKSAAIGSGELSQEDEDTYRAIFNHGTETVNMLEESRRAIENAMKIKNDPVPVDIPMYFFISDGKEVGVSTWSTLLEDYTKQLKTGAYLHMDSGHFLHTYEPKRVAEEIERFLDEI